MNKAECSNIFRPWKHADIVVRGIFSRTCIQSYLVYLATDGFVLRFVGPVTARFLTAYQRMMPLSTLRPTRDIRALMITSRQSTSQVG